MGRANRPAPRKARGGEEDLVPCSNHCGTTKKNRGQMPSILCWIDGRLELKSNRTASIEGSLERLRLEKICVSVRADQGVERKCGELILGRQEARIGHVENIESQLDLVLLAHWDGIVHMRIQLIGGRLIPKVPANTKRDFAPVGVDRMSA